MGNGRSIRIWKDRWVPRLDNFTPGSPTEVRHDDALVSDLIDVETGNWDTEQIANLFSHNDADLIRAIPLSKTDAPDILVWHWEQNGLYSVEWLSHAC